MPRLIKDVMRDASGLLLQTELQRLIKLDIDGIAYQLLSTEQISKLARKINLLPLEYRHILFLKYCFENNVLEIDKMLEIENSRGKLLYAQKMLSRRMGLENSWVDNNSMKDACKLALKEYMKDYNNLEIVHEPNYSKAFRRKLKDIKNAQKPHEIYKAIAKKVAIFILISTLGFSVVLAINVEAREKLFHWIMETFPKFSVFNLQSVDNINSSDLISFKMNYIPKGFELAGTNEGKSMIVYNYLAENNQKLTVRLFISANENQSYYDTENIEVEEFVFKESQAYIWQTDMLIYLVWYQDGIECYISGNLSKNEILKVAENIKKNN